MPNINSPAKEMSDNFLTHARLVAMKADLEEIQRLGQVTVTDEQIATVGAWILEMRAVIKFPA